MFAGWIDDSKAFIQWIEENLGERPEGMTLDREDNDGNYEPGNLRWATSSTQNGNRRVWTRGAGRPSACGFKWVKKKGNRFQGSFKLRGVHYWCGSHNTPEEAFQAVVSKRSEMGLPVDS